MIYLTSDTHFNHKSICCAELSKWDSGYRSFKDLKDMEDTLVDRFNSIVREDDIVYHLGDFIMGPSVNTELPRIRSRLACRTIHHIPGNHHKFGKFPELKAQFTTFQDYIELTYKGKFIVMFHYPIASWHHLGSGALHAFGHTHGSYAPLGRSLDVGVDCWDFYPLSIERFIDECSAKTVVSVDHHKQGD